MLERIKEELSRVEAEQGCEVLFASESGSRAWGFASPDSDYDVRFIYAHPRDWYLRLQPGTDVVTGMTPDEIDYQGWDLAKALRLFGACNPSMNEWLGSPQVYRARQEFHDALRELVPAYFNPKKAIFHYLGIAGNTIDAEMQGPDAGIKKVFYAVRPLLACLWIGETQTMPPTTFEELLNQSVPDGVRREIEQLVVRKATAAEGERIVVPAELREWIEATRKRANELAQQAPAGAKADWEPLNALMLNWVGT